MPSASLRRRPRPLAIVLATSTVALSLLLTGCEGDEASRADKRVTQELRTAYTTDNPLEALKKAADEENASGVSRARALAMLADAELLAANDLMRQVEQKENSVATLVWELNQLGQSARTSSRLIEAYRSYDPAVVQQAAQARVAEAQGDKISLDLRGQQVTLSGLKAVQQATAELTEKIKSQQAELAKLTEERNALVQQADQAAQQANAAKGREAVDAFAKASNLRKEASILSNKIETANSALARTQADLAVQQGQAQILARLIKEYQSGAAATEKGFKEVAAQEEAQQRLIKDIYGGGTAPAKSGDDAAPANVPATITGRAGQLAAAVSEADDLREKAAAHLTSAIQHYSAAQQAAEDHRRKIDEKMANAPQEAPERGAWEDMKKLVNPSAYQLQKSLALQTLGSLYAAHVSSLSARIQLQNELTKTLQGANLKLPESLVVQDGPAKLKDLIQKTNETYSEASDLETTVLDAPLATESQKAAARVAKILTLYAWGNAHAISGNANEAKKLRAESIEMVKGAVADNVTLPALPPEIAPAPKAAAAPAANPATTQPAARSAPAPAQPQGAPADPATVQAVKEAINAVADGAINGDPDSIKAFINADPQQQPIVDTLTSLVSGGVKLQNAMVAKFGDEAKQALAQPGMQMQTPDPAAFKAMLDKAQVLSTGPDTVMVTAPGTPQPLPLKKFGDQWKLDLAGAVKTNPQLAQMLPMMAMMFKPMADGINKIAADVEGGKYNSVAEVQTALQQVMPNPAGLQRGAPNRNVAQQPTAPAPQQQPPQ